MTNDQRQKHYVDPLVQGAILRCAVLFWLGASLIYAGVICVFRVMPHWMSGETLNGATLWYYFAPMAVSTAFLLPVVCNRAVRFSLRFVAPVVRFRKGLQQLNQRGRMDRIHLRKDDFWDDIADELNELADRWESPPEVASSVSATHHALMDSEVAAQVAPQVTAQVTAQV